MITHFEASNFKSLKHLSMDMRRFMVLVGPNGAGKTNLVRALEVFGEVLRRGTVEPIQEHGYDQLIRREKRPARSGLYFALQVDLPSTALKRITNRAQVIRKSIRKQIELPGRIALRVELGVAGSIHSDEVSVTHEGMQLISNKSSLEITQNTTNTTFIPGSDPLLWDIFAINSVSAFRSEFESLINFIQNPSEEGIKTFASKNIHPRAQEKIEPGLLRLTNWQRNPSDSLLYMRNSSQVKRLRLDASALRREFSSGESQDTLLGPTGEGLATAVAKLRGVKTTPSAQFRRVLESLQEVYPRIEDVYARRIPSGHLILLFKERGISEELGQGSISDGVLHALALLVALHQGPSGQAGLLAIEEPENAIHPWPLRKLIARAQKSSRQIILTTHSETVVNTVTDPENLFLVENDDKLGTLVTQATAREAALKSILEESGQRLGDVWLDGSLGGVPGVES